MIMSGNLPDVASTSMLIREMAEDERPREKALKQGIKSLSNAELMAILFGTGMRGKSVIRLSEEILHDNGNHLSKVARLTIIGKTKSAIFQNEKYIFCGFRALSPLFV